VIANGSLVLNLPAALSDDIAVKISKKGVGGEPTPPPNLTEWVYLPNVMR
jgi:hypothetical protein